MESPRFRAIIRATSGRRKRSPTDVKSFSHELNSKGTTHQMPIRKLQGLSSPEEIVTVIRTKFKRLKEEVNAELGVFAGDLVDILENATVQHPDWRMPLEDLLVICQGCAEMSPDELWSKCEGIVQNLDEQRQELAMGTLKQAHTRILFILTRCTRLIQFQKEGGYGGNEHVLGLYQLSDLGFYSESGDGGLKISSSAKDMKERMIRKRFQEHMYLSQDFTGHCTDSTASRARISSWKKLPSSTEKNQKKDHDEKDEFPSKKVLDSLPPIGKPTLGAHGDTESLDTTELCSKILGSSTGQLSERKDSADYSGDQRIPAHVKPKMICRICDYEIPTIYAEGHFRACTVADKCDSKGLTIDERLERVAEILEKLLVSCTLKRSDISEIHHGVVKVGASCLTEGSEVPSQCQYHSSSPSDADIIYREFAGNLIANNLNEQPAMLGNSRSALSSGSMTPQSPLMTPRTGQLDLLLSGTKAFADHENFQQIESLLDIVHCIARIKTYNYNSLEKMCSYLEDLNAVIDTRKVDALVVETFGRRITKLLQEKFIHLCGQIDDGNKDVSDMMVDEEGSLRNGITSISGTNPLGAKFKDRTSIEDFEIIKPISRGAFGRVFLAKKRVTGDIFAIKVLKKADMIRKNAVKSILAERNILISTRNPFVVRFYYSFTCRENLYLVMEYINGGDLYSLLRNLGCLDEDMARTYVAEVVLALEYLHSMNVIHRDLKPDNLLIAWDGHIKLTDFGLSKVGLINSTDDLTGPDVSGSVLLGNDEPLPVAQRALKREQRQKQSAVGTPDYLAPEILLGMPHGPTADWWSVGVILFELLVGIPPFNAEHPQKIFDNIMNRDIPWPQVPEEMSLEAYDLVDKLLIRNPVQRLGATGAGEVKSHPFFKSINWDMLARQKAAFIPSTEGDDDTSYFASRLPWNAVDEQLYTESHEYDDMTDTDSMSCYSSAHSSDLDEDGDECGSMADFGPTLSVKYSFSNFSFKNLSQLASINYDLITKCSQDSGYTSQP
ncbi:unnamed protein product [Musa acuminata subsp. malaccensis]|uniref:non-specific serine/threonine protein kinase n=1 Tax=Musa acuminata subsp. malaccensis TaxID=214687 RepID=A0A804KDB9_MUSAM|nr:PREDICTED: probable serine/threonine protein kinase IRE isoform X1 [Musa acuminata subsp. malaccensis]XP_009414649.1 PREDICTED: probable serine/threonine protein kinase IRE isoform X1 [Musa acuminata subsp. malaccensis]XP_009414650.1 PREDICTED: probable serine/threonine protein kinase IRE isoform X1 [Musa acuminata subsp. malaccensis]XP_018685238.1 PREDICTED: probable serine/threonine protein kinase IRE isoform X1 [Musa acuminata subsp. malaccensis]CAG1833411.1 unnamed protein product [Musa 